MAVQQTKHHTPPKPEEGKPAKSTESKEERFSRLASVRVSKAMRSIRAVGRLTGPASATQLAKIESYLTSEVRSAVEKLRTPMARADSERIEI